MSTTDRPAVIVSIACPSTAVARQLGRELVAARLVACAQVFPIHSIYRWQGQVEAEDEHLLQAKTTADCLPGLEKLVIEQHPYEVPEILATPVQWGHGPYLDWVREQTGA
jgi:periplasmic divalent cation tolerance protein